MSVGTDTDTGGRPLPGVRVARLRRRALLRGLWQPGVRRARGGAGRSGAPGLAEREERDLGVVAAVTDRGHRRPRNEDAMAIATADGRSVVVVCDGVASTANSHLASRAAADAVLAVLEPMLYAPEWPDPSSIRILMDEAFAEAQVAVTRCPRRRAGRKRPFPLDDPDRGRRHPGTRRRGQHRGQSCLLA